MDNYFKSDSFKGLVNKAVTQQFESFLDLKGFQDMLLSAAKMILLSLCDLGETVVVKVIEKAVLPLLFRYNKEQGCE